MDPRAETRRLLRHLRLRLAASGETQRRLERRAGLSRGYLSAVLGGHVELKYRQLLAILQAMGLDPGELFAEVFHSAASAGAGPSALALGGPAGPDLAVLFGLGLELIDDLGRRLERCEAALDELRARGLLD